MIDDEVLHVFRSCLLDLDAAQHVAHQGAHVVQARSSSRLEVHVDAAARAHAQHALQVFYCLHTSTRVVAARSMACGQLIADATSTPSPTRCLRGRWRSNSNIVAMRAWIF